MAKLTLKKGSTDVTIYIYVLDSGEVDGSPLTGLLYNTASLTCYYVRELGSATALSLATNTVTGAHSDGGFVEVDSTNMPGVYRLDLSDAVLAAGADMVIVMLKGAADMAPVVLEIQLTDFDLNSTSNSVGAAASVTAGVSLADDAITSAKFDESTAFPLKSDDSGATQVARVGADGDTLETLSDQIDAIPSDGDIADAVWDEAIADHAGVGSTGEALDTAGSGADADAIADAVWDETLADHAGAGSTGASVDAIKDKTDNLPASPAAVGSEMNLADDAITAAKFDESTAFPLKNDDAGATQVARVGADGDTLETLSDQLDTAQTDLDNPNQYKADVSALALEATLTAIKGVGWSTETLVGIADVLITYIKAKTDLIPASPAAVGSAMTLEDDAITAAKFDESTAFPIKSADTGLTQIARVGADGDTLETLSDQLDTAQADLDNPAQYKADVSGVATSAALALVAAAVSDILTDTGTDIPATLATLALESTLTAVKGVGWTTETLVALDALVDAVKAKTDLIPASPAAVGSAMTLEDDAITAAKFDESTAFPLASADTGLTEIARVGADGDTLETLSDQLDAVPSAADNADAIWDEAVADHLGVGSTGKALDDADAVADPAAVADAVWDEALADHLGAGSTGNAVDAIKDQTDLIPASPAAVGSEMNLADDAITSDKYDESTAFPLESADAGLTQIARVGADGDTLETLSDQMDTAQADLNDPDQYKADVSTLATSAALALVAGNVTSILADTGTDIPATLATLALEATLTAIKGAGWTTETLVALDALIDAVKAKTDLIPASPAAVGSAMTLADDAITADKYDELTAFPLESADAGLTQVARTGADGDTLETLSDQIDAIPSAADNADAVWDETLADHLGVGSAGEALDAAGAGSTPADIADAVWDELVADHLGAGSTGEALDNAGTGSTPADIADAVWDEALAGHLGAGTTGEALDNADAASDPGPIADAVWDELLAGHVIAGSAGEALSNAEACFLGLGSVAWEYTLTEPDLVTPIPDATVKISTDIVGADIIASGTTDAFGKITFYLDPGTYYVWCFKSYYTFSNPDTEVVV